jgi:uncharacterized protein YegL
MYTQAASAVTPALILYLIDASDSMNEAAGNVTRIKMVQSALQAALKGMARRSMRDGVMQRRYKIALFAYNAQVTDVLGGIRDLPDALQSGIPDIETGGITDTTAGFAAVEKLLEAHLAAYQECPAPLICHLTDGLFTTEDPSPIVKRLRAMSVRDGAVLVENIYIAQEMLRTPVPDWKEWKGVLRPNDLIDEYARFLFQLSSPIPETYRENINNYGYHLQPGAVLFFPGAQSELMRLAFAISTATQMK